MKERKKPWETIEDSDARGKQLKETFESTLDEQSTFRSETLKHVRLYRNLNNMAYLTPSNSVGAISSPLSLNVIRNMVNAVHSKITKHRVKATFQTAGASYEMREKAKKLDAYCLGQFQKEKIHDQTRMVFLDAAVTGTGVLKTFPGAKNVRFERVFAPNLVVDLAEGAHLCPAHYYEISYVDRSVLFRKFGKSEEAQTAIDAAPDASSTDDDFYVFRDSPSADLVQVVTAYYFNPEDEFDGFRSTIIAGTGFELEGGAYTSGNLYSVMRWSTSNLGWYGMGLAEELKGIQLEINRLIRKIQTAFGLLANPYILADRASSIRRGHLTDMPGSVIEYSGKEPRVNAPMTVHPEVFAHLDRLYQRAYEIAGISQLSAQSQKPQGLESGRAMLVYEDIESDRFADVHRQWDDLHVDAARKGIRAGQKVRGYKVFVWGKDNMEVLDFKKDIDLEEDEWMIRPMPTSFLGETPAAQIETAERLAKSGLISEPSEILEQSSNPDVAAYVKSVTSPKHWIEQTVGAMMAGKPFISPEPEMNLALALDIANRMYSQMRLIEGFPQERLRVVRQFMTRTKDLINMAGAGKAPPTMGATAAPGGPPPIPGGPMPPPPPAAPAVAA